MRSKVVMMGHVSGGVRSFPSSGLPEGHKWECGYGSSSLGTSENECLPLYKDKHTLDGAMKKKTSD